MLPDCPEWLALWTPQAVATLGLPAMVFLICLVCAWRDSWPWRRGGRK